MNKNLPQLWEQKFKECWLKSFPNTLCFKIPNQISGFLNVNNFADYMCFDGKRLYLIDCKSHSGASFPLSSFPQYQRLISLKHIPNLVTGIALWLYEKDTVCFVPTYTVEKMKQNGLKSINPKTINRKKYYMVDIPSIKLRTFMNSDWSIMDNVPDYLTYQEKNK